MVWSWNSSLSPPLSPHFFHVPQSTPQSYGTSSSFTRQQQLLCTHIYSSRSIEDQQHLNGFSSVSIKEEELLNAFSSVSFKEEETWNRSSFASMEEEEQHLNKSSFVSIKEKEEDPLNSFVYAKLGNGDPPNIDERTHSSKDLALLEEALDNLDGPRIASTMMKVSISMPKCIFLHEFVIRSGLENDVFLCSLLVSGFGKCGCLRLSRAIFDKMQSRNVVTWTALITSYAENGLLEEVLMVFKNMQMDGFIPNEITFLALVNACEELGGKKEGLYIHQLIVDHGLDTNAALSTALIKMYAQFGIVSKAWGLFYKMNGRDVVAWTAVITAHVKQGFYKEAVQLFDQMKEANVKPNAFTFSIVLGAIEELSEGKSIHKNIIGSKLNGQNVVATALVNMYGRFGDLKEAQNAFNEMSKPDSMAWTTLISVYAENGEHEVALQIFQQMQAKRIKPNAATFSVIMSIYAELELVKKGQEIHADMVTEGFKLDIFVENTLLNMYRKFGDLDDAYYIFNKMQQHDVVSWTTIMGSFMDHGLANNVVFLYDQMQHMEIEPDPATFVYILEACGDLSMLGQGQLIHATIIGRGVSIENVLGTAIINMYAKCGAIENALVMFESIICHDEITWSAIIMACAQEGQGKEVIELFERMKLKKVKPTPMTFVGILSGCSQSGMVKEGCILFESISRDYDICPSIEHYGCVVDMLGRGGYLEEAEDFIEKAPFPSNGCIWSALLGACRKHGDLERGKRAAKHVMVFEPENAAPYVLLSTMYSTKDRWNDAQELLQHMVMMGIKKKPGCTLIDVENKIHEFWVNDELPSKDEGVHDLLKDLENKVKEMGYIPNTKLVLHDVDKDLKEYMLGHHSERIALAFGLHNTLPGTPLRLVKNLRTCPDCHTVMKLISKIVDREIVLRDTNRVHHFKNGSCSCGDYW